MKWLAGIAVVLFCSGYWICDLLTDNLSDFWDLRITIYTIIFALCFTIGYKLTDGFTKAIFLVGIVFCGGDILDRYLFNINSFHLNDFLLYLFAIYHLSKNYARETKGNS